MVHRATPATPKRAENCSVGAPRASVIPVSDTENTPDAAPPASMPDNSPTASRPRRLRRLIGWMWRNAYLGAIAGAVLVLTRVVDFSPAAQVRMGERNVAQIVGDAPPQEFSHELSNPQAVQVRATLRLYPDHEMIVSVPDPDMDAQGKLLSQPVITTILGMNATIEQTVRLEDGDLEIDVSIHGTPRWVEQPKKGKPAPELELESEVVVKSRRRAWWRRAPSHRVHLDTRAFLRKVEQSGHRIVFTVDEHLFSLDLELHRAFGSVPEAAHARTSP
jgi:hypothetical protein